MGGIGGKGGLTKLYMFAAPRVMREAVEDHWSLLMSVQFCSTWPPSKIA